VSVRAYYDQCYLRGFRKQETAFRGIALLHNFAFGATVVVPHNEIANLLLNMLGLSRVELVHSGLRYLAGVQSEQRLGHVLKEQFRLILPSKPMRTSVSSDRELRKIHHAENSLNS
jgi:hypothetical protein